MVSTFPIGQPAQRQHIVHILNGDDLKTIPRLLWYILEILHILCRDYSHFRISRLDSVKNPVHPSSLGGSLVCDKFI